MGTTAVVVLVGCQSTPERFTPITQIPVPAPSVPTPTNRVVAAPRQLAPPPTTSSGASTNLADEWISWNRWCVTNGLDAPQHHSSAGAHQYALHTPRGTLSLTLGSRVATWDGLEFWLGFPPQLIDGQAFVHGLDLRKNLDPLLSNRTNLLATNHVIVLDPGHGGENTGTRSVLGNRFEKEYTLDWARRLQSLLATNGWTVILTRTNDTDLSLSNRVGLADRVKADLFLSLHFNSAFPNEKQSGLETYCLTPSGLPSSLTRDFPDDRHQVFPNNAFDEQNLRWAVRLQRALVAATAGVDRGVRRARFMGVLRGQNRPAVLVEGGYLSNPHEARLIVSAEYRQKLAVAIFQALDQKAAPAVETSGSSSPTSGAGP